MNRYSTLPPLPDRIRRLEELAVDVWWSWHPEGRAVFRQLDYDAWRETAHNPVKDRIADLRMLRDSGSMSSAEFAVEVAGSLGGSESVIG